MDLRRARKRIIGSGKGTYIVSSEEYGGAPFTIDTTLEFSDFEYPQQKPPKLGMNAGIVFAFNQEKRGISYYNVLLTGTEVLLERNSFVGRLTFEHLTPPVPFRIEPATAYKFRLGINEDSVVLQIDGKEMLRLQRHIGVVGKVGLRPWRSLLECTNFVVRER